MVAPLGAFLRCLRSWGIYPRICKSILTRLKGTLTSVIGVADSILAAKNWGMDKSEAEGYLVEEGFRISDLPTS